MNQRGFSGALFLIVILFIIGVGLISYFRFVKSNPQITPSPSVTSTPEQNDTLQPTVSSDKSPDADILECNADTDCSCGRNTISNECAYGNKKFIDSSPAKQCPDFCSGIGGHLRIKCISNKCTQVSK